MRYKVTLISRITDWDVCFELFASSNADARTMALKMLKNPDAWIVVSVEQAS
jgi:hypothetical protein